MEATGSDGGRGPSLPWSYPGDQIRSNNPCVSTSSTSGTIVSTTTYTCSGSRLSSISMDAVRHFELALDEDIELGQPTKKSRKETGEKMKHMDIKSLVQEFFGAPSAEGSININSGDMSVLHRWFSELDVAWVLELLNGDDASAELHQSSAPAAERWIRGLRKIMETICSTSTVFLGLPMLFVSKDKPIAESAKRANNVPDQIQFARFTKEAMSKMFYFIEFVIRGMPPAPYKKLHTLLAVYKALSDAQDKISSTPDSTFAGVDRTLYKLLLAKQEEVVEAIWSTLELIWTRVLTSMDIQCGNDSPSSLLPQASSDIHKVTLSVIEYISFFCSNYSSMCQILSKADRLGKYVPPVRQILSKAVCLEKYLTRVRQQDPLDFLKKKQEPVDSMIMDMKLCLQEKLVKMSESFPDHSLRFLFLLNNLEFIRRSLIDSQFYYWLQLHEEGEGLSQKVEVYMENYLQACWEPVLSCLFSPTPLCFGINHSPLLKFESEFNKTYTTQKLWKVPDPEVRKRLRTAITNKIVPRYTEYIEENNTKKPGVAPQDLEKMLQELFEG